MILLSGYFSESKIVMNQSKRLLKQESGSFNSVDVFYHTHIFSLTCKFHKGLSMSLHALIWSNSIHIYLSS